MTTEGNPYYNLISNVLSLADATGKHTQTCVSPHRTPPIIPVESVLQPYR
ncbi:hypothetical protein KBY55_34620 [Streptomyces sp. b94]|nr:hypothetical protein [Streptomyces sp. b94]MBQ1101053.1 hypothetical protein [Streptomyces sp. b94]